LNLTAYTDVVDDLVAALGTAIPVVVASVAVISGGLIATRFGFRWLRGQAK